MNTTLGKWSRFWFDLRMAVCEAPTTPQVADKAIRFTDLSAMKILYAEDNLMNQKVMNLLLKTYGILLVVANDSKEALGLLEKAKFDLMLMDFSMPEMDGFEATTIIRSFSANHLNHNIPIVGVSADVFDESTAKGLAMGMNAKLSKPIDKISLKKRSTIT